MHKDFLRETWFCTSFSPTIISKINTALAVSLVRVKYFHLLKKCRLKERLCLLYDPLVLFNHPTDHWFCVYLCDCVFKPSKKPCTNEKKKAKQLFYMCITSL